MAKPKHPLVTLAACWLAVGLLFVAADCLLNPTPNPTQALATRLPLTVLPTRTVYVFAFEPTPTVTPREMLLLPTRTPGPSVTRTPMPTWTPLPEVTRIPTQRG